MFYLPIKPTCRKNFISILNLTHYFNNLKFYVNSRTMVFLYFMCIAYHYDDK